MIAFILAVVLLALNFSPPCAAQALTEQGIALNVISYMEVAPRTAGPTADRLRQLARGARDEERNHRFEVVQRIARENEFAIVAIWPDMKAYEAHLAAAHTQAFRQEVTPNLISPIDDRLHSSLEAAGLTTRNVPEAAIYVVTHIDVSPPRKQECISALNALVAESRKGAGAIGFEFFQQINRPNHFSLIEVWQDQTAYDVHITTLHTKAFRERLAPMSGALYDERLYRALQ